MNKRYIFGEWWDARTPLTPDDALHICEEAHRLKNLVAQVPIDKIFRLLERVKKLWIDPTYKPRKELEEILPQSTGFSPEMISLAFNELGFIFDERQLRKKCATEFQNRPPYGNASYDQKTRTYFEWHPIGTVLHILSGNVFLVGAGSLIEGLLTRNVTILKMSSGETEFLPRLIESIRVADDDQLLSRSMALIDYPQSAAAVMATFKREVDGIVIWGGEAAVKTYRDHLPARTRVVTFGPKLSLAVVSKQGIKDNGIKETATLLAKEISIWDQNACTAPQACYVQGVEVAYQLAAELEKALNKQQQLIPAGDVELHQAVEIRKLRLVAEIAEAHGEGLLKTSPARLDWTVIVDKQLSLEPSPLHRTLRIIPFQAIDTVYQEIQKLRGYIQTIGVVLTPAEQSVWGERFSREGALRIVPLGEMAGGEIDDPHDGQSDLPQLCNLVINRLDLPPTISHPHEIILAEERQKLIDSRLRQLIDCASRSVFYSKRLKNCKIETTDDLIKLPLLSRCEMEENMPPQSEGLSTGPSTGGYVSRSGGSTGTPKFSVYDEADWKALVEEGVPLFHSLGLFRGDRVANFMLAGDLYGSFVSFDHINNLAGIQSFAFANQMDPSFFINTWKKFKINAIQGIPTTLVPFLRQVKSLEREVTLEKVIYAGSPLSPTDHEWMLSALKTKRISSVIGANDGGQIAFQCEKMSGRMHHTIDEFNFLEIVNNAGERLRDGEVGNIVITSLLKRAYPLIRYEIGDEGRIVLTTCPCGRTRRILEYLGRSDNAVNVGMMLIKYRDIEHDLLAFPLSQIQLVARADEKGEFLVIRVETPSQDPHLKVSILQTVIQKEKKIRENLQNGNLQKIEVEVLSPGALPRIPRSAKIKGVVDERH